MPAPFPSRPCPPDQPRWTTSKIGRRVLFGLLLGVVTSEVNHLGSVVPAWLPQMIDNGFLWLTLLCIAALPPGSFKACFWRSASFIYAAVISYYATDVANGVYFNQTLESVPREYFDFEGLASDVIAYGVFGTVSAALAALFAILRNRRGLLGIAAAIAAAIFIAEESVQVIVADLTHRDRHPPEGNLASHIVTLGGAVMFGMWNLRKHCQEVGHRSQGLTEEGQVLVDESVNA